MNNEVKKRLPRWRRVLFFLLTAADEAYAKYDGVTQVPNDLVRRWSIEIEETKKNLYIDRMRNRTSVSYWLQWLFPLVCMLALGLEILYAFYEGLDLIKNVNWTTWIITGLGGSTGVNTIRKVSRHVYLRRENNNSPIPEPARNAPGNKPIEPEILDANEDEDDGGTEMPLKNQT